MLNKAEKMRKKCKLDFLCMSFILSTRVRSVIEMFFVYKSFFLKHWYFAALCPALSLIKVVFSTALNSFEGHQAN